MTYPFLPPSHPTSGTRYTINIEDFKAGRKTVLVCTNALARGLDVQAVREEGREGGVKMGCLSRWCHLDYVLGFEL